MRVGEKATRKVFIKDEVIQSQCPDWNTNVVTLKFEVEESGAFQYGNQTCTGVKIIDPDGTRETGYDTRYWSDGLRKFANSVVEERYGRNIEHYEIVRKGKPNIKIYPNNQ